LGLVALYTLGRRASNSTQVAEVTKLMAEVTQAQDEEQQLQKQTQEAAILVVS